MYNTTLGQATRLHVVTAGLIVTHGFSDAVGGEVVPAVVIWGQKIVHTGPHKTGLPRNCCTCLSLIVWSIPFKTIAIFQKQQKHRLNKITSFTEYVTKLINTRRLCFLTERELNYISEKIILGKIKTFIVYYIISLELQACVPVVDEVCEPLLSPPLTHRPFEHE